MFTLARSDLVQTSLERLARGEPHPATARRAARPALLALGMLAALTRRHPIAATP